MLWDKERLHSVRAAKIREIGIYPSLGALDEGWEVKGWFNSNESFYFGFFPTEDEARFFVDGLHRLIMER